MLRDYRAALGENPVGTNSEITKALLGANSRKARFIASEARLKARINWWIDGIIPIFSINFRAAAPKSDQPAPMGGCGHRTIKSAANVSLLGKIFEASGTRIR